MIFSIILNGPIAIITKIIAWQKAKGTFMLEMVTY
jgi:hypothetical protein